MIAYLDSSALVKLVVVEPESDALRSALSSYEALVSSELSMVEVQRAVRRSLGPEAVSRVSAVFEPVALARVDRPVLERAGTLGPAELRSLDAIHLATALELAGRVHVVSWDERLLAAATAQGLPTVAPGVS